MRARKEITEWVQRHGEPHYARCFNVWLDEESVIIRVSQRTRDFENRWHHQDAIPLCTLEAFRADWRPVIAGYIRRARLYVRVNALRSDYRVGLTAV